MCRMFGEKFFSTPKKVILIDLGKEHQKLSEDLMEYIQRFKEKVLDIQYSHDEKELVKVCIQGMFDEYSVHLENLPLPTFTTLVKAARRTNNTVLGQRESSHFLRRNTQQLMLSNEREEKIKKEKEEVHCDLTCVLRGIIQKTTQRGNGIIDSTHHHHYFQFQLIK